MRASSRHLAATCALVFQILRPRMRQPPSTGVARVEMFVVSVPASGSVTPNDTCRSPAATCGRYVAFIASEPWWTTGFMPNTDRWIAEQPFRQAPDAAISSSRIDASVIPAPPPPYSSGMAMPTHPPSAKAR